MEGDHAKPAARCQHVAECIDSLFELSEFVIDLNANRLKRSFRRVRSVPTRRCRNRCLDDVNQFCCRLNGLVLTRLDDKIRDARRPAFFPVAGDDAAQLPGIVIVDDIISRKRIVLTHAHIQRRFLHVRKSAFRIVQLERGYPQIQQCAVDLVYLQIREDLFNLCIIALYENFAAWVGLQSFFCCPQSVRIPVNAYQGALFA